MLSDFFIKQGDTGEPLVVQLQDVTDTPITRSLIGATVEVHMAMKTGELIIAAGAGTVISDVSKEVGYAWSSGDTAIASEDANGAPVGEATGPHQLEVAVTFADGTRETFPNRGNINVHVVQEISEDASLDSLTHTWKRGDTLPYLRRRMRDEQGAPLDLTQRGGASVMFTMRRDVAPDAGAAAPQVHAAATVITPVEGIVEYRPVAADTSKTSDNQAAWAGEFEATFADGKRYTWPRKTYLKILTPGDLDPGIDP